MYAKTGVRVAINMRNAVSKVNFFLRVSKLLPWEIS